MPALRHRHITEPRFQYSFARALVRGFAIATLAPACIFTTFHLAIARSASGSARASIMAALPETVAWVLGLFLVLGVATFLFGIYISHKFVGPLKRIEGWSARRLLGEGGEKPALRRGDELGEIVEGLSKLVERKEVR